MIDDIAGYRFEDLLEARLVKTRTDLSRKQRAMGFPKPVKLNRQAWFPKAEVDAWVKKQIDRRDSPKPTTDKTLRKPPHAGVPRAKPTRATRRAEEANA